ncbi:TMV resistance protein N-like [Lycium ferocissimum]|uniref:TMV resistance protein N-like n=1 Tax=Lycium ferocissimum TaxID=112874 RepID=UPI0028157222|nr:TMV resistance protein N-like [Lycium ferocissimum]XP_059307276.1 TMV resistance protein N-like [Lycium ferocissimum]XP_059307277.1 TMV resistance protein N-like [Lycium ferocissimum]XP_059307278.1 TMV resistance protein N-like [Lycium ferocissimum]XP_059307279.1 TMV resistance protein N-like [Lycium ferocissimum]XP_059307280.1 TMV resistance protein N-like [Lycium ferocissimum]XP_059307281.1 TMV resistance protein N-like [Lycium ferocissimum]XP_059307282.1 TMV resistance protein N-like [
MRTPDFREMPNLEYLNLFCCKSLEEVDDSLGYCGKLIRLDLGYCSSLKRFPCVNLESLEYLNLRGCSSLEKFPEIKGRSKLGLEIRMNCSKVRELPSFILYLTHLTKLDLSCMENLVSLPSSIGMLKSLVKLDVSYCSKLEILPEEIGDLENLEKLDARYTLISRPPSSIARLNKLKFLSFEKHLEDGVCFEFPQVNDGLRSLEKLDLSYCNLIDGGLPEDIGSLSSLKKLDLSFCNLIDGGLPEDIGSLSSLEQLHLDGNNFEHLPRSIAQLGALRSLKLRDCERLKELSEFPQQLDTIYADWSNDSLCNSLFQNISSLQHGISASDSLRVFTSRMNIPSWFQHWGIDRSVSVNLPENWYVSDNFLGFAVCYSGSLVETTAQLIPLCDDGMSWMTQKLALSNHSKYDIEFCLSTIQFFLVPLAGLWDTSKANGKTPNDYGLFYFLWRNEELLDFVCCIKMKRA